MSFMQDEITGKEKWAELDGNCGIAWVPLDCLEGPEDNSVERWFEGAVYNPGEYTFQIKEGYGARLSAPGYLDATDWTVFPTSEEAEGYLHEMYHDAEPMDGCDLCEEEENEEEGEKL